VSRSKSPNKTGQYQDEFLGKVIASAHGHTYWKNLDSAHPVYNDAQAMGTSTDTAGKSETLRIDTQVETIEDFSKCLDGIQSIIQSYTIGTLNYKSPLNSELNSLSDEITLTRRESEILYYLSLNKSIKDIAAVATLLDNKPVSASTINAIIDKQLYTKFEVDNIEKLVEKANALKLILFQLDN